MPHHPATAAPTPVPDPLLRGRTDLGDLEILHCTDGPFRLDGGAMFGVVPKSLWQQRAPVDDQNRILLGTNCAVVRTHHETVLIETGIGNKLPPKMQAIFAHQPHLPRLARRRRPPPRRHHPRPQHPPPLRPLRLEHHAPHRRHRPPHLPQRPPHRRRRRARPRPPPARARPRQLPHGNYDPLLRSGQLTALTDDDIRNSPEITPGLRLELFPGHTAHMLAVHIESRAHAGATRHAWFIGDLIPTTAHLQPTWCMAFDLDPLRVIEERHRFLARAIPEDWLVLFPHDHAIPAARLTLDPKGRPVVRDPPSPAL